MLDSKPVNERREFLKYIPLIAAIPVLPIAGFTLQRFTRSEEKAENFDLPRTANGQATCASCATPSNLSWKTTITRTGEPGEPLIISGTIYQPDGVTPANGIVLFVNHTDATGHYNKQDDPFSPRLRAWMRTGKDGRYEFHTIKPGPYPHFSTPAHIHAHVYGPGFPEYSIDDYWFEGDPRINSIELAKQSGRGGYNNIISLSRDGDGILHGTRNIRLEHIPA